MGQGAVEFRGMLQLQEAQVQGAYQAWELEVQQLSDIMGSDVSKLGKEMFQLKDRVQSNMKEFTQQTQELFQQMQHSQQTALGRLQKTTSTLVGRVKYNEEATKELAGNHQQRSQDLVQLRQELVTRDVHMQVMEARHCQEMEHQHNAIIGVQLQAGNLGPVVNPQGQQLFGPLRLGQPNGFSGQPEKSAKE